MLNIKSRRKKNETFDYQEEFQSLSRRFVVLESLFCCVSSAAGGSGGAGRGRSVLRLPPRATHRSPSAPVLPAVRVHAQRGRHRRHTGGSALHGQVSQQNPPETNTVSLICCKV